MYILSKRCRSASKKVSVETIFTIGLEFCCYSLSIMIPIHIYIYNECFLILDMIIKKEKVYMIIPETNLSMNENIDN